MADTRRYIPNQPLDLAQILQESQQRWLRPAEICEILRNYQKFQLTPDPPVRPPAGSLFLFDRKALRYFRKDGHRWRKKKDGKTVKEAHEKLKAGSVDVLHCYYAHGEDNENFQRRSYWMLDGQLEHIVLVHYREVKEGYRSGVSRSLAGVGSQAERGEAISSASFIQGNSSVSTVQPSQASSSITVGRNEQALSSEVEDVDSRNDSGVPSHRQPSYGTMSQNASQNASQVAGLPELSRHLSGPWFGGTNFTVDTGSLIWPQIQSSTGGTFNILDQNQRFYDGQPSGADFITHKLTDGRVDSKSSIPDIVTCEDNLVDNVAVHAAPTSSQRVLQVPQEQGFKFVNHQYQDHPGPEAAVGVTQANNNSNVESGELKKLDSFGRWMDQEIGVDCDNSLVASDSGNYWNTLDAETEDKEVSSLSGHMQLDIESMGPSLSQEQLFTIRDFSPDWAYSGQDTKVLIIGNFLGSKSLSGETKWGCMFGEIEVHAEVLTGNVLRCQAPSHIPGRVPFYVTCSNRLACSEIREFEFREKPPIVESVMSTQEEEVQLLRRLAKLLYLGSERRWVDCSVEECDKCKIKRNIYSTRSINEKDWEHTDWSSMVLSGDCTSFRDKLIQYLLMDRLCEWLVCKIHEGGKGPNVMDERGLAVIHLAAALGYYWAMGPIIAAGISPNFRDARGRTALHWASYFGREETVITLVRLGAAPGAVDDPIPAFPGGQTAADLASTRGHKGIAGYLAEADLTSHLSSLAVNQNGWDNVAASLAAERAIETAAHLGLQSDGALTDQLSLRGSLAAVRNSAHAAALIQQAFRVRSFHHGQRTKMNDDVPEESVDLVALGSLSKVDKMRHFDDYLHFAAVKIQQKYRGWKGRKDYLKIRNRIVKLQAHVRGHQVRKQYKKVVWSVSIVEKAILRWRRRGAGLRGFRVENKAAGVGPDTEKTDEYEFLLVGRKQKCAGVEKALERVKSMVRNPEARDQYMRLVTRFENLRMVDQASSASLPGERADQ